MFSITAGTAFISDAVINCWDIRVVRINEKLDAEGCFEVVVRHCEYHSKHLHCFSALEVGNPRLNSLKC